MNREEQDRVPASQDPNPKPNPNPNPNDRIKVYEGKSCKGCLYYSSLLKSESKNPMCVGIPRTLKQGFTVLGSHDVVILSQSIYLYLNGCYVIGESELEAAKEGRTLRDFKYACVGYSVYLKNKDSSTDDLNKPAELPFCVGLEVLMDRRPSAEHVPNTHAHSHTDGRASRQPQTHLPAESIGDEYISRFKRSASLVASGVAKNLNRIGSYVKESLYEILYGRSK